MPDREEAKLLQPRQHLIDASPTSRLKYLAKSFFVCHLLSPLTEIQLRYSQQVAEPFPVVIPPIAMLLFAPIIV